MKKIAVLFLIAMTFALVSCKGDKKIPEPAYVLQKWAKAIEKLDYQSYAKCEAYPKSDAVFRDMYKEYYITDIMTVQVDDPDENNISKDFEGNSFMHRSASFEASAVKRNTNKPYQLQRGEAVFVKFLDGKRYKDGWLLSSRTIININK